MIFTLVFQFLLFRKGHHFVKTFINFSGFFVYFGLFLFLIIIASEHYLELRNSLTEVISLENIFLKSNISPLIAVTGTMFAYFSIIILNIGDFSRYASSENELKKGNLSLILNVILFSILALLITLGADIILKSNLITTERLLTNPTDIIGKINNTYLTTIALIFILVASLSTNLIANYIPSQNSLLNFLPKQLNLNSSGLIIILLGLIISMFWLPVLSQVGILSLLDTLGAFFGPIFGLIIADYYVISKKNIINKDIFSSNKESAYIYSNGWHIKAVYSVLIGFIFAASTIWNLKLNFLQSFSWILGAFVTFLVYYLLSSKKINE